MPAFFEKLPQLHIWDDYLDDYPPHLHNEIEIILCRGGEYAATCGKETYTLHENDMIFIFPDVVHAYKATGQTPGTLCFVSPELLPFFAPQLAMQPRQPFLMQVDEQTRALLEKAKACYRNDHDIGSTVGYLYLLFSRVLPQMKLAERAVSGSDIIPDVLRWLEQHFREDLSLMKIAQHFGFNPEYFSAMFSARLELIL